MIEDFQSAFLTREWQQAWNSPGLMWHTLRSSTAIQFMIGRPDRPHPLIPTTKALILHRLCAVTAFVFLVPSTASAGQDAVPKGVNLNFVNAGPATATDCKGGQKVSFQSRLVRYNEAPVRQKTISDLTMLRKHGVTWIRTLIWFSQRGENDFAFNVDDEATAVSNLRQFAKDLKAAGISKWILSFGPEGVSNPSCRRNNYGDCYDPDTRRRSIQFIISLRRGLVTVQRPELIVDLNNEGCPAFSTSLPRWSASNKRDYLFGLIKAYYGLFPYDQTTVSCVGDNRVVDRLNNVKAIYAEFGTKLSYGDVHLYARHQSSIYEVADAIGAWGKKTNTQIFIGETNVNRPDVQRDILAGFRRNGSIPAALVTWPLEDSEHKCRADTAEVPK